MEKSEQEEEKRLNILRRMGEPLIFWYQKNKRDLPWREDKNPYHIWLSEIMLQQTRVEAVISYYARFLEKLPTIEALAQAPEDELLKLWQGLGYYNRAHNMQKAAQMIVNEYGGSFPDEFEKILALPGIGPYTAGAIASIAFGICVPAVDGNGYRIYSRLFADESDIAKESVKKRISKTMEKAVPKDSPGEFNQGIMELGETVCLPHGAPKCAACPIGTYCALCGKSKALEFPFQSKKPQRKRQKKTVILIEYQGKYLLNKRPDGGLLPGLWEFLTLEENLSEKNVQKILREGGIDVESLTKLGENVHVFTHIEWHMLGYLAHVKSLPESVQKRIKDSPGAVFATPLEIKNTYSIPSAYAFFKKNIGV